METPQLERRLAAIFAADVHGYSRLMGIDETATLERLTACRKITDELIADCEGRIANTAGDSVLAEFPTVLSAVRCAVAIQRTLAHENDQLPEARRMQFRIGINLGDVMVKDFDIFGDGVNIAARLEGLAEPGGICVSRGVRDGVRGKLPYLFEDVGVQTVKNIAHPIRAYHLRFNQSEPERQDAPLELEDIENPIPAERQQIELAFWDSIKESKEIEDFDAYLAQFPDGNFRTLAENRLALLRSNANKDAMTEAAPPTSDVEMVFWDSIKDSESAEDYSAYLKKFPSGAFVDLARARLANPPTPGLNGSHEVSDATALELALWDSVKDSERPSDLEEYLKQFPNGTFTRLASVRLEEVRGRQLN